MRDYTEEELKILSDMLPNIALQLRTSLATVYTAVDRLVPADMREKDAKTDRTAAAFYQSYYRLYRVISNLTDAGQLFDRKRFELYDDDIVGVCRSVCGEVDFLFNMQGVTLDFLSDRDSRIIGLDAAAIRKMLLNLLSNALKFTPQGGSVRVRVKTEGRNVKITVADSGCGMNSDTLAHLFDRFIDGGQDPMPPRGLGLGLPICQRIAQGHGGRIVAQSEEGNVYIFMCKMHKKYMRFMLNHVNLTQQLQYYHYPQRMLPCQKSLCTPQVLQHKRHLTACVLIPTNCNTRCPQHPL